MAFFTSAYKVLAHLAPNWDTQLRQDMQSLEDNLAEGTFTPGLSGSGATAGSGASFDGFYSRKGQRMTYWGHITFGTGASWGTGTPQITGLYAASTNLNAIYFGGTGRVFRTSGAFTTLQMTPGASPTGQLATPIVSSTGAVLTSLSAPGYGDQLLFTVDAIIG